MSHDHQQSIRESAYRKWEAAGCPEGCELSFWLEAERELGTAQRRSESPAPARPPLVKAPVVPKAEPPRTAVPPTATSPPKTASTAKPVTPGKADTRPDNRRGR